MNLLSSLGLHVYEDVGAMIYSRGQGMEPVPSDPPRGGSIETLTIPGAAGGTRGREDSYGILLGVVTSLQCLQERRHVLG